MATAVNFPTGEQTQQENMFPHVEPAIAFQAPQLPLEEDPFSEFPLVEEATHHWMNDDDDFDYEEEENAAGLAYYQSIVDGRARRGRGFDSSGFDSFVSDDGSIRRQESRADEIRNELRTMEVFLMAMNRELQNMPPLDSIMLTEMLCGESKLHLVHKTLDDAIWYGGVGLDSHGWDFYHNPCDDCHDTELAIVQDYLMMDPADWCALATQNARLSNPDLGYDRVYAYSLEGLNSLLRAIPCRSHYCRRFECIPPPSHRDY
jgi:hypothetical protein